MGKLVRVIPLFMALMFSIVGCGDVPRPFQGAGSLVDETIITLQDSAGIYVALPEKMEQEKAQTLANEVVKALHGANIPASTLYGNSNSHVLVSQLRPRTRRMGAGVTDRLFWALKKLDGTEVARFESDILAPPDPYRSTATKVAAEVAIILQDPDESVAPVEAEKPRIYVEPIKGAPGNGNVALTRSLRFLLQTRGALITRDPKEATLIIRCKFNIAPPKDGQQAVNILWTASDAKGKELGRIRQKNNIPAGSLDGRWGNGAEAVAAGGVEGIGQILDRKQ